MKSNRIYIFTSGVSRKNGGSSSILDLANNLNELGFTISMITPFGFMDKYIYKPTNVSKKINIKILKHSIYSTLETPSSSKKIFLNKILNIFNINDMHIKNSIIIDAIGLPYAYLEVLKSNNCKIILNHAGSPNAYIKYFGMDGGKREDENKSKNKYLNMISKYDYILFQSRTQANTLNLLNGSMISNVIVLTPGVNELDIQKLSKNSSILNKNYFNITVIGSVQQRKGQYLVINIANKIRKIIPSAKFHIIGNIVDKIYYKKIRDTIKNLNLEDTIFLHGFKTNYLEYMNSSDIILQLSEEEGVSRVLREAMALGKPIVSFSLDGTNDLLENGNDSLLSDYGQIDAIIQNIILLYKDENLYSNLSKNIKNNFEYKYSQKKYLKKLQTEIVNVKDSM